MKTQPATGETYPKSDLFNKAAVSVYFLISYLKDRKKTKLTFNKRKW
ncbi:TPA: small membrane protein [Klebsiella pneumoniae]|nr:small membrane protein [Klebsiella pneumoniae]